MNQIPTPLTLPELIALGGLEGSEQAYESENGLCYGSGDCCADDDCILYRNHIPFTGLYYELHQNGILALYSEYQNGLPIGHSFEFSENGAVKSYTHISANRLDSVSYTLTPQGKIAVKSEWKNGTFTQTVF